MGSEPERGDHRERLKSAVVAIKSLQAQLDSLRGQARQAVAIVGIGCRLPGAGNSPDAYWELLQGGVDAIGEIPEERWRSDAYYDPRRGTPGKSHTRRAGIVPDMDHFDPDFFGISPREALCMDPQQRVLLETAWEALEDAGIAPDSLRDSGAGVFIGATATDYLHRQLQYVSPRDLDAYLISGTALNAIAGRLAYVLGLHGPAITLDTACSSSLVAVDRACRSLQSDECAVAVAGGVNLILSPEPFVAMSRWGMLSADGRCKTFDADADGYVRAEGCGVVILKPLARALADGDRIHAVIRSSAVNQDGPSSGLSVPNGPAQVALLREALRGGDVEPASLGYLEAHGTGTPLGDPIELEALGEVFQPAAREQPLYLGSVKTNIGHLESAAGVAGLLKVVLMLRHGQIPPHLHLRQPTPKVDWNRYPFRIPTELCDWPAIDGRRLAGVSSFGASGTNAHLILEAPPVRESEEASPDRSLHLLTLSARSEDALRDLAGRMAGQLQSEPGQALGDVCHTAGCGRSHLHHRLALVCADAAGAGQALQGFAAGGVSDGLILNQLESSRRPRVAFLFTGQGSQYPGMGRGLYQSSPTFARVLDRCDAVFQQQYGQSLLELVHGDGDDGLLDQTRYTQPALFSLEVALASLWRSWGIEPDVVLGHSVGEYAAACVAGVFSVEDGLRLIAERGRLMQAQPPGGRMVAVHAPAERVLALLESLAEPVSVAAFNSPVQTVVSGSEQAVRRLLDKLSADGVEVRPLKVSHAFHSALMEPMLDAFEAVADTVTFRPPERRLVSNLSGRLVTGEEITRPDYWRRHVREPVRFTDSVRALAEAGCNAFVEIGPHPVLLGLARECGDSAQALWLPSLRRGRDDWRDLLESLARLHVHGAPVDWQGLDRDYPRRRLRLPSYPFRRDRFMVEARTPAVPLADSLHPLVQRRLESPALRGTVFESLIDPRQLAFLPDHRVLGRMVFPATAFLEATLAAARLSTAGNGQTTLREVQIAEPMVLQAEESRRLQVIIAGEGRQAACFQVFADGGSGGAWRLHASGEFGSEASAPEALDLDALRRSMEEGSAEGLYADYARCGLGFGERFRGLRQFWRGQGQALGLVEAPAVLDSEVSDYHLHPALLDAGMQLVAVAAAGDAGDRMHVLPIPVSFSRVICHTALKGRLWSLVELERAPGGDDSLRARIRLAEDSGRIVAELEGVVFRYVEQATLERLLERDVSDWLYRIAWQPVPGDAQQPSLPTLESVGTALQPRLPAHTRETGLDGFENLRPALDRVCTGYVVRALAFLGLDADSDQPVAVDGLTERLGVIPEQRQLFRRCLAMLEEDGLVSLDGGTLRWLAKPPATGNDAMEMLKTEFPAFGPVLTLTERCGTALGEALAGTTDPLQLLFPAGDLSDAEQLQRHSPSQRTYNALVADALREALQVWPKDRPLRVLEVGAGTGATSASVLPLLAADNASYLFTDVSPLFLSRAKEAFRDYPFVDYRLLDLECDPEAQGIPAGSVDIIIASNVVHATRDLHQSLGHLHAMLAPGGWLLLVELVRPQRWVDLTFGLTEGWWRFRDRTLRPDYPLLGRSRWRTLLTETGFDATAMVPAETDCSNGVDQALVLAQRDASAGISPAAGNEGQQCWLVFADAGGVGERLAAALRARGDCCELVFANTGVDGVTESAAWLDPADPGALINWLGARATGGDRQPDRVVYLWALDGLPAEVLDAASTDIEQERWCGAALALIQGLARHGGEHPPRLWICTRGAQAASADGEPPSPLGAVLWGLGRVAVLEHPELRLANVDLDPDPSVDTVECLLEVLCRPEESSELACRRGLRWTPQLQAALPVEQTSVAPWLELPQGPYRLGFSERGSLDNLRLEVLERREPGPGEAEVRVVATALNFRDVLNVMGLYPGDPGLPGAECSGTVLRIGPGVTGLNIGDAVVALPLAGGFASHLTTRADWVVPVPPGVDVEAAATIPSVFLTAHLAVRELARPEAGERVLIHSAAGGVGLAAVMLAQALGAEVLATAGSAEKRRLLREMGVAHVMDSRSPDFADTVLEITDGRGVDVVLNSLTDRQMARSFEVTACGGRFVELGKRGIWTAEQVEALGRGIRYFILDVAELARREPERIHGILQSLMGQLESGEIRPLPYRRYTLQATRNAFRSMARGRHVGKLVVCHPPVTDECADGTRIRPDGSYLVTGGLRGLGLLTASWLVSRGARHLLLTGRGEAGAEDAAIIESLRADGVEIRVAQVDVADEREMARVLAEMRTGMPALRGVIHSAGVLDDGALLQQRWHRFRSVFRPKVQGSLVLDRLTAADPLDFFVLYSSLVGAFGTPGQANHAAANAYMDSLVDRRRALGVPGLSVSWGAWSGAGAAVERGVTEQLEEAGYGLIPPQRGFAALEAAMATGWSRVVVLPADWERLDRYARENGRVAPMLARYAAARVRSAQPVADRVADAAPPATAPADLAARMEAAAPNQRRALLMEQIRSDACRILGLDEQSNTLSSSKPLRELGLDSLMSVELRNAIGASVGRSLPATLLFDYPTVNALVDYVGERVFDLASGDSDPDRQPPAAESEREFVHGTDLLDRIEQLDEDDIDRLSRGRGGGTG
ncbi:SDR family NAD(P)-dependent oxidoreductase [Methylonatrum kenyense]|uniref:type I polyketide synthase n=1 Tax=Methylonatrum kenyense TaxID=455253 RepID=UPI0020BD87A8|nr:type I polyketide synthase [Methylonatrum kenyense]MCK8516802.1 SDR family NAD(P)-dependent oxidoreductase [Methylonatrum kenyense]